MANWYGTCRSNYFKVKDLEAFSTMLDTMEAELITKDDLVGFIASNESGSIPDTYPEDDSDPVSILDLIADHLAENHVCVIQEVGAEKARYLTGYAFAIAWTGEMVKVSIDDIYKLAQAEFGGDAQITEATY